MRDWSSELEASTLCFVLNTRDSSHLLSCGAAQAKPTSYAVQRVPTACRACVPALRTLLFHNHTVYCHTHVACFPRFTQRATCMHTRPFSFRSEFQPLEDGYRFSSTDKPVDNDGQGHDIGRRTESRRGKEEAAQAPFGDFRGFWNHRDKMEAKIDEENAAIFEDDGEVGGGAGGNHGMDTEVVPPNWQSRVDRAKIMKRARAASIRDKESAAWRGRQSKRQAQDLGAFNGYIQVQDPALNTTCDEYGLTEELAEAKYR